jgi:hypothetical protein
VFEGFAQFVRHWSTDKAYASQSAPEFFRWWEQFVDTNQKVGPALREMQDKMHQWQAQSGKDRIQSKIGLADAVSGNQANMYDRLRYAMLDDAHGLLRMVRDISGKEDPEGNPYKTFRNTRGIQGVVDMAVKHGVPVLLENGDIVLMKGKKGKSFLKVLDPVSGDMDTTVAYFVAKSASELYSQGRENLLSEAEIRHGLSLETPERKKAFEEYQVWNKGILDFAQKLGVINPESRASWNRDMYLPFYRHMSKTPSTKGAGIEGNYKASYKLTGGTGNLRDIVDNMLENATSLIQAGLQNRARAEIVDFALQFDRGGAYIEQIPTKTQPVSISKEQFMKQAYESMGFTMAQVKAGKVPEELLPVLERMEKKFDEQGDYIQFWQHGMAPKGDDVIAVMRNGKAHYYQVGDELLMQSIRMLNRPGRGKFMQAMRMIKTVGQMSVTLTPDFMSKNLPRDSLMGTMLSKHGFRPGIDSLKGLTSRIKEDKNYVEFMLNGGGQSSMYTEGTKVRRDLEHWYTSKGIDYKTVIDTPGKIFNFLNTAADAVEVSTRLGEYARAREDGASRRDAAYEGREISTDFGMRGGSEIAGFFFDTVMFAKAAANGLDRVYRGIARDSNKSSVQMALATLAISSAALYANNREYSWYNELPDYMRDTYWYFVFEHSNLDHKAEKANRADWDVYMFPKIWEFGAIASVAERMTEQAMNVLEDGTADMMKLGGDIGRLVKENMMTDLTPQILKTPKDIYYNEDSFTGAPIETRKDQNMVPALRGNERQPRFLRDLTHMGVELDEKYQVSAPKVDAFMRGYFNTWWRYAGLIVDKVVYDDLPDMDASELPVSRNFVASKPSKNVQMVYELSNQANMYHSSIKELQARHEGEIAARLKAAHPEYQQSSMFNKVIKHMSKLRKNKDAVYRAHSFDDLTDYHKKIIAKEAPDAIVTGDISHQKKWLLEYFDKKRTDTAANIVQSAQADQEDGQE